MKSTFRLGAIAATLLVSAASGATAAAAEPAMVQCGPDVPAPVPCMQYYNPFGGSGASARDNAPWPGYYIGGNYGPARVLKDRFGKISGHGNSAGRRPR